jgi:hypothetical protein
MSNIDKAVQEFAEANVAYGKACKAVGEAREKQKEADMKREAAAVRLREAESALLDLAALAV